MFASIVGRGRDLLSFLNQRVEEGFFSPNKLKFFKGFYLFCGFVRGAA
ncbi:MAG: hypothetical protein BTN85_0481 [Candidatus Methanohalarchaeum thermophilum]|uniref:Uncharacterized protein n=1 Tax=Methanohalarchaeum thermophilum TaxID=1903181 RepID=A0A1Q6DUH8_METT1|nr:MAG: hypothetical protein BTN85_0481 [Candidatus Methanohalarchaeum thermophilum]